MSLGVSVGGGFVMPRTLRVCAHQRVSQSTPMDTNCDHTTDTTQGSKKQQRKKMSEQKHEEYQYLDLVREILDNGEHRPDR